MSAKERGFSARNRTGCSRSLPRVSVLKGTEPITKSGFNLRIFGTDSSFQQSPNCGRCFTGATSEHQRVTPTSELRAPSAQTMDVALGARETIRIVIRANLFRIAEGTS